jgi:hypothetical protein
MAINAALRKARRNIHGGFIAACHFSIGDCFAELINRGLDMTYFPRIFSTDSAKAAKASGYGYLNAIHYLAPYDFGGAGNLCPNASPECIRDCLGWFSGQAAMVKDIEHGTNSVRESRKLKAQLFMRDRANYLNRMAQEIVRLDRKARREGLELCVRLNGSSDIVFERISFALSPKTLKALGLPNDRRTSATILALFPHIQFVEYTKSPNRLGKAPGNLDLTLSYSARNSADCVKALLAGHNVAMVFYGRLPASFAGFPVINGDLHDLRHLDAKGGFIVGLSPKGAKAKRDKTGGFVVDWQGKSGSALEIQWWQLRPDVWARPAA